MSTLINVWSYDRQSTNLGLTVTSSNTSLATVSVTATNVASATNAVFTLSFALTTNDSGTATIHLVANENGLTTTTNYTMTVTLVNHAPSFTLASNYVAVGEESATVTNAGFVSSFSKGPANQATETFTYTLTTMTNSPTNALFATMPAVSTNGTLTFQPKAHSFGTNPVTVVMTLSGGTNNGGIATATNTFQIRVAQTNHAPIIVGATNRTVLENATNASASINVWSYDLQASNFVFTATSSNTSLATVTVTTNSTGTSNVTYGLAFALATNNSGTATIHLVATEGKPFHHYQFHIDGHDDQPCPQLHSGHQFRGGDGGVGGGDQYRLCDGVQSGAAQSEQ